MAVTHVVFPILAVAALSLFSVACSHNNPPPATITPTTQNDLTSMTSASSPSAPYKSASLSVSADLLRACNVKMNNATTAPKFDFDDSTLLPQDRDVLAQIAKCVSTGPLAGRSLELVGRTDPRGTVEYNFALGEHRAATVDGYLAALGVDKAKLLETSRGELDATGNDNTGWQRDRRVDILLR